MKKVLIIDDDVIVVLVYERFLKAHGFAVDVARDGAAALELLVTSQPDAVLLALMMPKVNGMDVLKRSVQNQPLPNYPSL